jgi:hypothetical protein
MNSLSLLKEYLKLVLISEGKIEDLAKQNPNVDVQSLASSDITSTKKLLPWMIKQVSKGADVEHVKSVASRFAKDGNRLSNKDINSYSEIDELESALDTLGASKRSQEIQAKSGAVKIYEDDKSVVLRIDTKEAAQQYGKGTKWCITMSNRQYYETYKASNVLFYYTLRKELLGDDLDKVALAVTRDKKNVVKQIQAFDQADTEMTPSKAGVSTQTLTAIKSDAKSQPKAFLAKIKSGDKCSDEELITYWENLTTEQNKIAFLITVEKISGSKNKLKLLLNSEKDEEMKEILSDLITRSARIFAGDFKDYIAWQNRYGQNHRDNDKPARIYANGDRVWYQNDMVHRDGDKPAKIFANGDLAWYQDGYTHRDGGKPAVIYSTGMQEYYIHGRRFRENGLPATVVPKRNV